MAFDDEDSWLRQVLLGLGALVVVSVLVGGVVGAVVLGATKMTGVGETDRAPEAAPSLYLPTERPTTRPDSFPDPPGGKKATAGRGQGDKGDTSGSSDKKKKSQAKPITLQAVPVRAQSGERIDLSGAYRGGDGATLQVQRFEAGWTDFPVTATVRGGLFSTFIFTERAGKSRFRVLDEATGKASNAVTVTIG